jgi:DNA-binding Lrp family transcriptional regulator
MPRAFVLLNITPGTEDQVLKAVRKTGCVEEAYHSYGVYDLIVRIKAESIEDLKELVTYQLRKIVNVTSTLTLIETE